MKWDEALLHAMNDIRDDLVEQSAAPSYPRRRLRWLPVAACFLLLLGAALLLWKYKPVEQDVPTPLSQEDTEEQAPDDEEAPTQEVPPEASQEAEDYLAAFLAPRPVYTLKLEDNILSPAVAVDNDGNIVASVDYGSITPIYDRATGEILAVTTDERDYNQAIPTGDNQLTIYSLQGEELAEVEAYYVDCLGEVVIVSRSDGTALYRRGDRTLLGSYSYAATVGDDLVIAQENGSDRMTLFNASGDIVAEDIALQTELFSHVWQGHGYLSALDSQGRVGLMDSTGSWAIAPEMDYIYGISNGYALCVLEDGSYRAISLEDGTTFDCAYGICDVYDQGLILELDETAFHYGTVLFTENAYEQFVSWDGTVLAEGNRIQVLDDEGDGNAELVLVTDGKTARLYRPDGSLLRELDYSMGSFATISSQTFLCMNNTQASDGSWYMDVFLLNTETGETFRDFDKPYSYGSDLWFSVDSWGRYTTHLFYAQYQDEEGNYHTDLLDESGKVLLTDLVSQYSHQDGGVFTVLRDGKPALMQLNGTVLYESS